MYSLQIRDNQKLTPNQELLSFGVVHFTLFYSNSLLALTLNESKEPLNQSSGILLFSPESLLTKMFKPSFLTFVFNIANLKAGSIQKKVSLTILKPDNLSAFEM